MVLHGSTFISLFPSSDFSMSALFCIWVLVFLSFSKWATQYIWSYGRATQHQQKTLNANLTRGFFFFRAAVPLAKGSRPGYSDVVVFGDSYSGETSFRIPVARWFHFSISALNHAMNFISQPLARWSWHQFLSGHLLDDEHRLSERPTSEWCSLKILKQSMVDFWEPEEDLKLTQLYVFGIVVWSRSIRCTGQSVPWHSMAKQVSEGDMSPEPSQAVRLFIVSEMILN